MAPHSSKYASIVIGIILATTASLLAFETKGLLTGEGATPETLDTIQRSISQTSGIRSTNEVLTMHFGPNEVLLNVSLGKPG